MLGGKKGTRCTQNPDGSITCQRYRMNRKGEKETTGTEITIRADPDNNCEPTIIGDADFIDGEDEDMAPIMRKVSIGCKKKLV